MDLRQSGLKKLGEFDCKEKEKDFFRNWLAFKEPGFSQVFLLIGVFFFLFSIFDLLNLPWGAPLFIILFLRAVFLCFSLFLFFNIKKTRGTPLFLNLISLFLGGGSFFLLLFNILYGESYNFFLQAFSAFLITFSVYHFLPNPLKRKVSISLMFGLGFVLISYYQHQTPLFSTLAVAFYLLIINAFSLYTARRIGLLQRKEYLQQKALEKLAVTDPLTGIANRRKFKETLDRLFSEAQRYNADYSLIIFDIDNFKEINDRGGHLLGDRTLVMVAGIASAVKRESDLLVRLGGDEFAILMPSTPGPESNTLAKRLAAAITSTGESFQFSLSCSFGVSSYRAGDNQPEDLVIRADRQLYLSKESGKNDISWDHGPELVRFSQPG